MKKEKQSFKAVPRRKFFLKGVLAGASVLFGIGSARASTKEPEMVKLITSDGKLVEVPRTMLPKSSGNRTSNRDLLKWKTEYHPDSNDPQVQS